ISYGLWTRRFGRDPNIVGRTMTLDGAAGYVIHGVMPQHFNFPSHSDVFRSSGISSDPNSYERRDFRNRFAVARLKPGVSQTQAQSAMQAMALRLEHDFPASNTDLRFRALPLREIYSGPIRPYAILLLFAVALVLAVACVNVASLQLSRLLLREREIAIRLALGASRWSVARQVLIESLLLSTVGGGLGFALAHASIGVLAVAVPVPLPPWIRIEIDPSATAFLVLICAVAGVASALAPAWHAWRNENQSALKEGMRGSSHGLRQRRLRNALIIAEVALAAVLLVGSGLLAQSVARLQRVNPGFNPQNLLTFRVEIGWASPWGSRERNPEFHRLVLQKLSALPGVHGVTLDDNLPLSGKPRDVATYRAAGQSEREQLRNPYLNPHTVGPNHFSTMGIPLLRGRDFSSQDRTNTPPVVIVSRSLAERLWPGVDPIGQRIQPSNTTKPEIWDTVIGVAENVLHHELDAAPSLDLYYSYTQFSPGGPYYVIRTEGDPLSLAKAAPAVIGAVAPDQSYFDAQTMARRIANRIWQRRVAAMLFGVFAALAFVLAAVGLYGGLSFVVTQQRLEVGVRLALGATAGHVTWLVLRRGLGLASLGAAIGLPLAYAQARLMAGVLFEVSPADPATFVIVLIALLAIAAVASLVPARCAIRVDPMEVLRHE
ncbi:MAG: FtsX-like permease family protein, partial [Verrucomicrobiae bacterium]|nr:FtsX-like permease family protein [Verrucomicrobiae bacterium]